jgi:hypothetical protein
LVKTRKYSASTVNRILRMIEMKPGDREPALKFVLANWAAKRSNVSNSTLAAFLFCLAAGFGGYFHRDSPNAEYIDVVRGFLIAMTLLIFVLTMVAISRTGKCCSWSGKWSFRQVVFCVLGVIAASYGVVRAATNPQNWYVWSFVRLSLHV